MKTKRTSISLVALLLLVGIFSTCTSENITVIQIEDNTELATRQHVDMSEFHYYHVEGFSVELRLKPQALSRNRGYSIATDTEMRALSSRHNVTLRQSYPGFQTPELQLLYTLTIRENDMNVMSRSSEENKERRATVIEEFLATGLFEDNVRKFEPTFLLCANPVLVNDPHFRDDHGWALRLIQAPCAWSITRGNPNVWIGIVDTDFDTTHEDLNNKFAYISGPISHRHAHGTTVASIAAANTNNGRGMAGIGHNSRIAARRVVHHSHGGTYAYRIREAIVHLYNMRVPVINVSWAHTGLDIAAVQEITRNGTTLVLAAGNTPGAGFHSYLAHIPGVILVSGVDRNDRHEPTHTARNQYVSILAPSKNLKMAMPGNAYVVHRVYLEGTNTPRGSTSLAAPFVSGTIALMLSVNPTLTPAQIENILITTAAPIADGGLLPGRGRLNAYAAVRAARNTLPTISGTTAVCSGVTNAVFSISELPSNATVRWVVDAPLAIVGANNQRTVTIRHTGATTPANSQIRAEISLNGGVVHIARHNVAANRPIIKSITASSIITTGSPFRFFANHSYGLGLATWSVSPNHSVLMHSGSVTNTFEVSFMLPGNYTVSALVTNACGSSFMNKNITVTGASHPAIRCSFCGTCSTMPPRCVHCPSPDRPPDLLREPIEKEETLKELIN